MFYFVSPNKYPLHHVTSGKFVCDGSFKHSRRNIDTFVLLVGVQGTLYISQNNRNYELTANKFLILFPGHEHYGYKECEPDLSYYWCHFQVTDDEFKLLDEDEISQYTFMMQNDHHGNNLSEVYILPEYGTISARDRTSLVFRQLLDLARKKCYTNCLTNYALSLLALEISQEYIDTSVTATTNSGRAHQHVVEVMEWIRINYNSDLSVQKIADTFSYNPDYLSSSFKKFTGVSLIKYINRTKISVSKQLLLNSSDSIKKISAQAGFNDEKNFMKLFKQFEDITPTQYRNAFYRTKLNKI